MLMTMVSRVAARAVIAAALAAGSLGLAVTAAGACTGPAACGGTPPASVHAGRATTARSGPRFQPCPCDKPICRPGC